MSKLKKTYTITNQEELFRALEDVGNDFSEIQDDADIDMDIDVEEDVDIGIPINSIVDNVEVDSENLEEEIRTVRPRKLNVTNRLINSIDCAFDDALFDPILPVTDEVTYISQVEPKKGKTPAETITWTNIKQHGNGRQGRQNIISGKPGPTSYSSGAKNQFENWNLFFSEAMMTDILERTNQKIEMFRQSVNPEILDNNKITYLHNTSLYELYAFFGLVHARGLQGQSTMTVAQLFSES